MRLVADSFEFRIQVSWFKAYGFGLGFRAEGVGFGLRSAVFGVHMGSPELETGHWNVDLVGLVESVAVFGTLNPKA